MVQERYWELNSETVVAPQKLVEPAQTVVTLAMMQVRRWGTVSRSQQTAFVTNGEGSRIYKLTDLSVQRRLFRVKSTMMSPAITYWGLSISGVKLNTNNGEGESGLNDIYLPRDPRLVNRLALRTLRGVPPSSMERLAKDLETARKISEVQFREALSAAQRKTPQNREELSNLV